MCLVTNLTVTAAGPSYVEPGKDQRTIKKGRFKVKRVASGAQEDGLLK